MEDKKIYYYGNEVSSYGVEKGYVDYRAFANSFNHILNNDIITNTQDIGCWETISNGLDAANIERLEALIEDIENKQVELVNQGKGDTQEYELLDEKLAPLYEELEEAETELEVYQYFIVDGWAVDLLLSAGEIVYYNEMLDMYVWGVTHWGTAWDYVLTSIKL